MEIGAEAGLNIDTASLDLFHRRSTSFHGTNLEQPLCWPAKTPGFRRRRFPVRRDGARPKADNRAFEFDKANDQDIAFRSPRPTICGGGAGGANYHQRQKGRVGRQADDQWERCQAEQHNIESRFDIVLQKI